HYDELTSRSNDIPVSILVLASLTELMPHTEGNDVWDWSDGWQLNLNLNVSLTFTDDGTSYEVNVTYLKSGFKIEIENNRYSVSLLKQNDNELNIILDGKKISGKVIKKGEDFTVFSDGMVSYLHHFIPGADIELDSQDSGVIITPMPGKLSKLYVKNGERVEQGQSLVILEAMKMEHTIKAPLSGIVEFKSLIQDMQISDGQTLMTINSGDTDD
ncbi:MAG: biotin/lipoyl-binding protein, partial [Kordiimonadaceae bacterium]|nr:biotin/lipoyl-binding protein [Kordiimonadaceae bacterium]